MNVRSAFDWQMPVSVTFGAGCAEELPAALGDRRAIVLAFEPARTWALSEQWRNALGARLVAWVDVDDGLSDLAAAHALSERVWPLQRDDPDCVLVGLGGGTTLDLAKLVRCRPLAGGFDALAAALRGTAPWPAMARTPLWLVPTTAGTGSEVTRWATVWDLQASPPVKRSFDEPWGYAERAFVDPLLTLSCPPGVTRSTALDTLAHALEALWNRHANPISSRLAIAAARRVIAHLPACVQHPDDPAVRSELSLAALEAGLAFSQTRTALAHALSYALTIEDGVPHGLACAVWLPTVWALAAGQDATVDRRLGEVFGDAACRGPVRLLKWLRALGIDARPEAFGVTDAPARIAAALGSARGKNFVEVVDRSVMHARAPEEADDDEREEGQVHDRHGAKRQRSDDIHGLSPRTSMSSG
jgi:phosphonate metabolism-associated iron-containing alcohol dehydrogenase